ncbi:MAG: sulfite exporter TauE/SafE family protein [Candidatus Bathyarchaeia archaeon]
MPDLGLGIPLFILSLFIAAISSLVGLGGGVFLVPSLILIFGLPSQKAVGASLFTMTFTTISATIAYARQKKIDYKIGILLDVLDVPGATLGAYVTTIINSKLLATIFGIFLFIVSIRLLKSREAPGNSEPHNPGSPRLNKGVVASTLAASFASGFVAGMLGAGGGTVDETVMILFLGMPATLAAGTAEFGMALTNLAALIPHWMFGNVLIDYVIPLALGAILGAQIGPHLSKRAGERIVRRSLAIVFAIIGIRMLLVNTI